MKQVILVGFMGAGKTTIGKLLAKRKGMPYYDIDEEIVQDQKQTIAAIFAESGEEAFRKLETAKLQELLGKNGVISTGGGIVLNADNRELLTSHPAVFYLQTSPTTFLERLKEDTSRPLIQQKTMAEVEAIFEPRVPLYEGVASHIITTDGRSPEVIVEEIIAKTTC
ncbi:Shikimate kinase 1 [Listeria grayi]|uniref:Shikimate kinase n=1 Tax=Listeria grayi FSL F6-1183 TaxID=1265827 RepID=A0A829R5X8_LISGR|nr:shikimate kinase [Listeria grayi]EUJ26837.1 hypothetical protein LMUR_12132 [Listeria grayi FSL F6-1183]MBC1922858.1 shikimate kinase [Listeria grayi]VEI33405.1 Shikimate kinase 1 [Listeria grayi]